MSVTVRFAPSPTGFLHIGSARTALFNWLFARHHGGKFLLRIEDTDRQRSSLENVEAIYEGMKWLGLDWDGDPVSQYTQRKRHASVANQLVEDGKAYYCYCTPEELEEMRAKAKESGSSFRYDRRWRDRDAGDAPAGVDPVIRIKAPLEGETVLKDAVQGDVTVGNAELDDFILLRSDGSPTYMLSVVVDDHDMDITHVIRGDDHLTNTFRQLVIYNAMGWDLPVFAHIPLIHGPDGGKLSKRHGALGVGEYETMGYLSTAMNNYLLRLGWSHGDDEIIPRDQAIAWFDLDGVGRSPAKFDFEKLNNLNAHYMKNMSASDLIAVLKPRLLERYGDLPTDTLEKGIGDLTQRINNLNDLADAAGFYLKRPIEIANDTIKNFFNEDQVTNLGFAQNALQQGDFTSEAIEQTLKGACDQNNRKFKDLAMPLRMALTGSKNSPSITHIAANLGKEETLQRISDVLAAVQ